jgi:hypothetical protein
MEGGECRRRARRARLQSLTDAALCHEGGRLPSLIGALPVKTWTHPEAHAVATRLIALLPHALAVHTASGQPTQSLGATMSPQPWWIYVAFILFVVLGIQFDIANRQGPPAADHADLNPAANVSPPQPPGILNR